MVVARGMMIMDRFSFYSTSTTFSISESGPYSCGETIHLHITVSNVTNPPVTPTGTVQIYDFVSNTIIGSSSLISGSATITTVLTSGNYNFQAQYLGGTNGTVTFSSSVSSFTIPITASNINTNTSITSTSTSLTCVSDPFSVTVSVTATPISPSEGVVTIMGYQLSGIYTTPVTLGTGTPTSGSLTLSGLEFPALGNSTWFLQAFYTDPFDGACYNSSSSNGGTEGIQIEVYDNTSPTTTTIFGPSSGSGVAEGEVIIMDISISNSFAGAVGGTVNVYYSTNPFATFPSGWTLGATGTAGTPIAGICTVNISFPVGGGTSVYCVAVYSGNSCFDASMSELSGTSGTYFLISH